MASSIIKGLIGAYSVAFNTQPQGKKTLTIEGTNYEQVYFIFGGTLQNKIILSVIETWNTGSYVKNLGDEGISVTAKDSDTITVSIPSNYFRGAIFSHKKFDAEFST